MAQELNLTPLIDAKAEMPEDNRPSLIKVSHVSMGFNTASQRLNSLKEYAIALVRGQLHFGEFRALDDVSFEVKKGDVFGILGTNGSGKSTMLKIIAGVLEPTQGEVTIKGKIAPLIELGAGFDYELTARENVYLNGALLGYSKKFISQHFDEIVEFAEVANFIDMPLKNYSSGMVARIAFAIATVIVPEILIVDEVLSVGDFMFQQKCEQRIQRLIKEYGVTVLIVSHDTNQVERLCNKAIWIEKGHTRIMGRADEVCKIYRVLGGHGGSREAEAKVLDYLKRDVRVAEDATEVIAGHNYFDSAVKIARRVIAITGENPSVAVIAPVDVVAYCLGAQPLCAAFGAPLLLTKNEELPEETALVLKSWNLEKIFVLGSDLTISKQTLDAIAQAAPGAEILPVEGHSSVELSYKIYQLGKEVKPWNREGFFAADYCESDLFDIAPFIFGYNMPVLYCRNGKPDDRVAVMMKDEPPERMYLLGGTGSNYQNPVIKEIRRYGVETQLLEGGDEFKISRVLADYLADRREREGKPFTDTMVLVSALSRADAFGVGVLAGQLDAVVYFLDPQNLDSVAGAIEYMERGQGAVKHLVFVGGNLAFGDLDREILSKAMVANWKDDK